MKEHNPKRLLHNPRFYILLSSVVISIVVAWLVGLLVGEGQIYLIRLQQLYGLLAVAYLYGALIISPLAFIFGKQRMERLIFARRAIGVSAFYFTLLHGSIALWGQFGGIGNVGYLPSLFQWSFIAGAISTVVLGLMASTSFDKVIAIMTIRRWKWLHRLVYMASVLILIHAWSIGTHLAYPMVQVVAFAFVATIVGLEMFRLTSQLNTRHLHLARAESLVLFVSAWFVGLILLATIPLLIDNYHSRHESHSLNMGRVYEVS